MINKGIKVYKNLVAAEVTDFNGKIETLYWEGSKEAFAKKWTEDSAITFPLHNLRVITTGRIIGFDDARSDDNSLQHKISKLHIDDQEQVKMKVKIYKKDFGKYPSNKWVDNVIDSVLNPEKTKEEEARREIEGEKIRELKKRRLEFFNGLDEIEQKSITDKAWDIACEQNPNCEPYSENIYCKGMFIVAKNTVIDEILSKK